MRFQPITAIAVAAMAAIFIAGCSKSSDQSSSNTSTTTTQSSPAPAAAGSAGAMSNAQSAVANASGDAAHGKSIFTTNCAQCHGATGTEGGVGPSLKNEKSRKNTAQAIAWIKNPQPPMPKLYPGTLNDKDVTDVAAYVESL
ncbi:MAG: cytochrome c [Candidatus Velthaea sp.]